MIKVKKILQIGEGNFLRAFAEDYIQKANEDGLFEKEVVICQPRTNTKVINALKAQKNEYSVVLSGRFGGEVINGRRKITCVSQCIDTQSEYKKLEELFCSDELEIVISNTTESGICFDENEIFEKTPNMNFPARVTNLLYQRFKSGKEGIVFLPVELIEDNAQTLKKYILQYAKLWNLENDFSRFVENECSFCNTLVDRIVSGHKEDDEDPCSVAAEPYASWIIQPDGKLEKVFPLNGFEGIQFSDNLSPYRTRKVRILNGTHTMSVLAAYMCCIDIVRDMMNNEAFSKYISQGLEEIKQTIELPREELDSFAKSVLERFNNPFINHKLFDISLNSTSKFKARCLPTILDYIAKNGNAPKILSFAFAAYIAFYTKQGTNREYIPNDSPEVIDFFASLEQNTTDSIPQKVLSNSAFWGEDLSQNKTLLSAVEKNYESIINNGIENAVKEVING